MLFIALKPCDELRSLVGIEFFENEVQHSQLLGLATYSTVMKASGWNMSSAWR